MALSANEIEAANRAEATAVLIRSGYRVYRPEADVAGEDLLLANPTGALMIIQLKGRPAVDWARYGGRAIWMLFPDPRGAIPGRPWFLVPHDELYAWFEVRHAHTAGWSRAWSVPQLTRELRDYLGQYAIQVVEYEPGN